MLQFFRKYQRYFFIVVTTIIVLSFSFFGTYSSIETTSHTDRTAFVAVDGQDIRISDLEGMALFLGTDAAMKRNAGGTWGNNFLNDGVIVNDFLRTGLAEQLVVQYSDYLKGDLEPRLKRERGATFYVHPSARFISADAAWTYFAPDVKKNLDVLRATEEAVKPESFNARVQLYLAEQQFPAQVLSQVLRYQEQQYNWIAPDPNLPRTDLSLFGYHTFEDWFGPRFVRLVSEFIINAAKIAQSKGYEVSFQEALADLIFQAELSFKELSNQVNIGATPRQYMNEQLRRMGMDEVRAVKIWQQVLLFRRLFDGVGSAIFVDPQLFLQYTNYALETAEGTLYQLPDAVRLQDFRALQKFEVYLNAVSDPASRKTPLALPTRFLTPAQVQQKYPELVHKRYLVDIAEVSKKSLQGRVGVREMWNWEVQDDHWELLKKEFPELATKKASNSSERFALLDVLDPTTRARVDDFARSAIVEAHPDWMDDALAGAKAERRALNVTLKEGALPLIGVEDREGFIKLLDAAPLNDVEEASPIAKEAQAKLQRFSGDKRNYYRIDVIDRGQGWEIFTFAEAAKGDALNKQVQAVLDPFYQKIRATEPTKYRQGDQSWKPIEEVQDLVATDYYKDLLSAIEKEYRDQQGGGESSVALGTNGAAANRLLWYVRQARTAIQKDPTKVEEWVAPAKAKAEPDHLAPAEALADQWKLQQSSLSLRRSDDAASQGREVIFALTPHQWTDVASRPTGELWFFQLKQIGPAQNSVVAGQQISKAQAELADEGERMLMYQVLHKIKEKNAISFGYLERDESGAKHRSSVGGTREETQDSP